MPETYGAGVGFIDYDGDDWPDIFLVSGAYWPEDNITSPPALRVFRNNKDGTFSETTSETGLDSTSAFGFGLAAADIDNDGDQDIFLSTLHQNLLFRNDEGLLTEIAGEAGLGNHKEWSTAPLFFDANADGWVDLYVGNYVVWSETLDQFCTSDGTTAEYCMPQQFEGLAGRFFLNQGDGTFVERTQESGVKDNPGKTLGVAELDYDDNGIPDFVVANDTRPNMLYKNNGDGTFEETGMRSGVALDREGRARAGMGVDTGYLDGSRNLSIVIGNFSEEMAGVFTDTGSGYFVDKAAAAGIGRPSLSTLTFGLMIFDVELDGDEDVLLANGHILEKVADLQEGIAYRQKPQLFLNDGTASFELLQENGSVLDFPVVARGIARADYDRDGDMDVLVSENGGPVYLWQNNTNTASIEDSNFLRIKLQGYPFNRDALGTAVELQVDGLGRQTKRVNTGGSYLSHSETILTFGLGRHTLVDSLKISWPDGSKDVFTSVDADQEILITQGKHEIQHF